MAAERRIVSDKALDIMWREARTHSHWCEGEVSDVLLQAIYDLTKFGPTSANCCPARFVFLKSKESKERLRPHLDKGNVDKTMNAPVTTIIAYDLKFYEKLPELFPHKKEAKSWFAGKEDLIRETAFRNGTLQGGYFILAARALGVDCGPMSGFNKEGVKKEFFSDNDFYPNFLCNLGYGDPDRLFPRSPRLTFDDACSVI